MINSTEMKEKRWRIVVVGFGQDFVDTDLDGINLGYLGKYMLQMELEEKLAKSWVFQCLQVKMKSKEPTWNWQESFIQTKIQISLRKMKSNLRKFCKPMKPWLEKGEGKDGGKMTITKYY